MKPYPAQLVQALFLVLFFIFPVRSGAQILPDIPDLIVVSVDHADNGVLIKWEPSADTGIQFYQLWRRNPDRTFSQLLEFSSNILEFKHMNSGLSNLAYAVTAETSDGRRSIFSDNVHQAVNLYIKFDLCTHTNTLTWTSYEGWEGEIAGYNIYGAISGEAFQLLDAVQASTNTFEHTQVTGNASYTYYIETINALSQDTSLSALETVATLLPQAPSSLTVDHVTVVDEATVELQFTADISGPVKSFRVLRRSNPNTPYMEVETLWNISESKQVILDEVPTSNMSYQYILQSVFLPESCTTPLVLSESNTGNSILLLNEIHNQMLTLSWTPYESYEPGLAAYMIQRRNGNGDFVDVATTGPLSTQWQEPVESLLNGFQPGEVQYRVIALSNPDGWGVEEASYSNITVATVETHMQVPTAFTPGSNDMNFEFKPQMDFAPREYLMMIMDRGGRKMFETTDPGDGWDGRFQGGEFVNEAVYVYYIQYTDYTGLFRTLTGNVTVLYP
ncbi:MAG: gliding motility-associated C-terminal domain-containing protein [Bacteroidales bacterium]|nr:gliding motility-associated C-terminal domain-containing protein [Bacteroidales bacterium]